MYLFTLIFVKYCFDTQRHRTPTANDQVFISRDWDRRNLTRRVDCQHKCQAGHNGRCPAVFPWLGAVLEERSVLIIGLEIMFPGYYVAFMINGLTEPIKSNTLPDST